MARKLKRDLTVEEQLARGPMDLPFLMLVLLLTGIGLIMMFSASYAYALYTRTDHDATYYFLRQGLFGVCGHTGGRRAPGYTSHSACSCTRQNHASTHHSQMRRFCGSCRCTTMHAAMTKK